MAVKKAASSYVANQICITLFAPTIPRKSGFLRQPKFFASIIENGFLVETTITFHRNVCVSQQEQCLINQSIVFKARLF